MLLTASGAALGEGLSSLPGDSKTPSDLKAEEKELVKRLASNPKDAIAMVKLGYVRERQGKVEEAIKLYRQSVIVDPKCPDGPMQEFYIHYSDRHDLKKAKALLQQARDIRKTWWCPWYYLGKVAFDQNDFKESSRCMQMAMIYNPKYAKGWNDLGCSLGYEGRMFEARDAFRKAVALKPGYSQAWANLCGACLELGDKKGARSAVERALRANSDNSVALTNLAMFKMEEGKNDEAILLLEKSNLLSPNATPTLYWLGTAQMRKGNFKVAENLMKKAVTIAPLDFVAWEKLVELYKVTGEKSKEIAAMNKAVLAKKGRSEQKVFGLAQTMETMGYKSDAAFARKRGLDAVPQEADVLLNVPLVLSGQDKEGTRTKTKQRRKGSP